jgi:hypothetical protein
MFLYDADHTSRLAGLFSVGALRLHRTMIRPSMNLFINS